MNISDDVCIAVIKLLTDILKKSEEKIELTNEKIDEILQNSEKEISYDVVEKVTFYLNSLRNIQIDMYTAHLILDKIDLIEEIKSRKKELTNELKELFKNIP